jgi:hypothetical protein
MNTNVNTDLTWPHLMAIAAACTLALAVLFAMLFGWNIYLDPIGIHRTLRDVGVALWAFLLPAWFTVGHSLLQQTLTSLMFFERGRAMQD